MDKIIIFEILESDDYFRNKDTMNLREIEIVEEVDCIDYYKVGDKVFRDRKFKKYLLKGDKYPTELKNTGNHFKSYDEVIEHIKKEFTYVYKDEYYFYFLNDDKDGVVVIDRNREKGFVRYTGLKHRLAEDVETWEIAKGE